MILAVTHHAGGVGKTHLTLNLSYQLAKLGKRVLMVDLDPQADLSRRLGVTPTPPTLAQALVGGEQPPIPQACQWNGTLVGLLSASLDMAGVEPNIAGQPGQDQRLAQVLRPYRADYILVDCAPSLGLLTRNAWFAADGLLIPVHAEDKAYTALDLIYTTLKVINKYRPRPLDVFGLVATRVDTREKMGPEIVAALQAEYPAAFSTFIPARAEAKYEGRYQAPVSHYEKGGVVGKAYAALAQEVINRAQSS